MPKSTTRAWVKGRNKFVSGYCNDNGKPAQCEGTRPKSGGKPLPTCPFWLDCPCECHERVDEMFRMTGVDRHEMPNPEYVPYIPEYTMPDVVDPVTGAVASIPDDTDTPAEHEQPVTVPPEAVTVPLVRRRTPSGYAGRGTLEAQVWEACSTITDQELTTKFVSEWIASKYAIPTPSRGAIQAVWVRWDKMNFASWEKKPVRFTGFLGEGTWAELERKKSSTKWANKNEKSKARRGFR